MTSLGARQPSGVLAPELSFNYSYDSNKNVTAEQRGGSMALYSWNATFDAMDRLNSQNDGVQTRSWTLDTVGNTTSETLDGNAEARTLNDMHAPTDAGNKAYTYDNNGQMTAKPGYTLVWDARNHLVSSSSIGSPGVPPAAAVSYRYDAFGNRVSKGSTRYLLVGNQVVAEFTGSASKQYCYGYYVDEVLAEFSFNSAFSIQHSAFYSRNRQYNTVALTDAVCAIVEQYSTDAMGRVKAFDAAATAKPAPTATTVLFTGRVFDAETGLYYFRARYFDPELGVFVSRDPLGFVDGFSVYHGWLSNKFVLDYLGLGRNGPPLPTPSLPPPPRPHNSNPVIDTILNQIHDHNITGGGTKMGANDCKGPDCEKITIIVELGNLYGSFEDRLIGHTYMAVGNDSFDFGPNYNCTSPLQTGPGRPWWSQEFGPHLSDIIDAILNPNNPNYASLDAYSIRVEWCVKKCDSDEVKAKWKKFMDSRPQYCLLGTQCTTSVAAALGLDPQGNISPESFLFQVLSKQQNTCGDKIGKGLFFQVLRSQTQPATTP